MVDERVGEPCSAIEKQMVREGIRKIHDAAKSFRDTGKYLGHAHWSLSALELLDQNLGTEIGITDKLSHEHVLPVGVLVNDILLANPVGTELEIYVSQILEYSIVAIIRDYEAEILNKIRLGSRMPTNWKLGNGLWVRYVEAGLMDEIRSQP